MARDKAHRFSNRGRKQTGKRRRFESVLDSVAGIGKKTQKALLSTLGSVEALKTASDEQILAVKGVTRRHLAALRTWLSTLAEFEAETVSEARDPALEFEPNPAPDSARDPALPNPAASRSQR
jgi:ERCC4-type nuclease